VVSQQIVLGNNPADRWLMVDSAMSTMPVVVMQPAVERARTLERIREGHSVRPLAQHRANEAFGLAVRARRVWPGAPMLEPRGTTGGGEGTGPIARAVVRQHATHSHTAAPIPGDRAGQEGSDGRAAFIDEHFGVGNARTIVNTDVDVLPAVAARLAASIPGDAMPDIG
jgi:hypothetical protein